MFNAEVAEVESRGKNRDGAPERAVRTGFGLYISGAFHWVGLCGIGWLGRVAGLELTGLLILNQAL